MNQPVDIFGELTLLSDSGIEMAFQGSGRIIELNIANVKAGYLLTNKSANRQQRKLILERSQKMLAMSDLELHIFLAKRCVGFLTPHSRPTLLSRLFGIAPVELKPLAFILALMRIWETVTR